MTMKTRFQARPARPVVLVSPDLDPAGSEMADDASSVSEAYQMSLLRAGAVPLALPLTTSAEAIARSVALAHGVLLTGGNDVNWRLYDTRLAPVLRAQVNATPDGGRRDLRELLLIAETFRQRKPLLAICRGLQMLNVALGGTLVADLARQRPKTLPHRRMDKRWDIVHEVRLTPDSLLAKITGTRKLGVNSTHHQAVGRVAPGLRVTGTSPDGVIEALEWKAAAGAGAMSFVLAVQFHPERLAGRFGEHQAIFDAFSEACAGWKCHERPLTPR